MQNDFAETEAIWGVFGFELWQVVRFVSRVEFGVDAILHGEGFDDLIIFELFGQGFVAVEDKLCLPFADLTCFGNGLSELERSAEGFVKARTAQANQIRGLLLEYGITIPQGIKNIWKRVPEILGEGENELPGIFRQLLERLSEHLKDLDNQVDELDTQIHIWHQQNEASKRIACVPGIGPITATALIASIGDASSFTNGRQLAAWLGLVPRQHSSGGKPLLQGISKRGDTYLRTLLIHGGRSVVRVSSAKTLPTYRWLVDPEKRRNKNIAAVALANKNARIVWGLLTQNRE